MNRIERDLSEISALRSTLQDDREYTSRLRTSLQDETVRLRELQAKILTQVIHNPPGSLTGLAQSAPSAGRSVPAIVDDPQPEARTGRAPEIIVPSSGKAKGSTGAARDAKAAASSASGGRAPKIKADDDAPARSDGAKSGKRAKGGDAPADESFNFTFVQK